MSLERDHSSLPSGEFQDIYTGDVKDGGLEGIPQLLRIPQSTQIPQISTHPVHKLLSHPLILEPAHIQPWLGWYHSPGFKVQLKSYYNKPLVGIEELSTPVELQRPGK